MKKRLLKNYIEGDCNMRYKKGDRVKIKSLEWYYANKNSEGAIIFNDFRIFDESMSEFCGKVVTIDAYVPRGDYYDIKEDGKVNFWSDDMIEGLADEPQEKMVSLDKAVDEFRHFIIAHFSNLFPTGEEVKYVTDLFRKRLEE